jgi:cytochrome c oxidase subunit 2
VAIADLLGWILLACGAIFAVVAGLVVACVVRFRGRAGAPEPRQVPGSRRLEIAWTVAPLLLVVWMFALTARTMRASDPPADRDPDLVVVGHQWWWEVRYPRAGVITANEIHVPVATPWLVRLESADVIHDFWVPELARKVDMVPGHPNHVWLAAERPGTYLGACAEFCGVQHAWMRLRVIAEPPAAFAAWLEAERAPAAAPAGGPAARGRALFTELTCASCHAIAGTGAAARIGPDLTHLASRRTLGAGLLENTPAALARWLADPQALKPGSHMPDLELDAAQVADLAAYLGALR